MPPSRYSSLCVAPLPPALAACCFHCGQPAGKAPLHAVVGGAARSFCCGGCQALALTLHEAGFGHLYDGDARFARPLDGAARSEAAALWPAYDTAELRAQFVRPLDAGRAEITLAPEGIRCAACAWLIEQQLSRLPGVESVVANVATRRVLVRWRIAEQPVSALLAAMADIGYLAWPFEVSRSDRHDRQARRRLLMRMAVAMLGMMQVMMYAWPLYTHQGTIEAGHLQLMRWASFALTLPVVLYSAFPIFAGAWRSLRRRHIGMDVPVALGLAAAFAASAVATLRGSGEVYFDSVTMFVALLLLARYLELRVRQASRSGAEMLARQLPATCERLSGSDEAERVPVARLRVGERIRVRAGEIVPVDGVVLAGRSELDESMLTGESRPVPRGIGDPVLAGCFNAASPLEIRVDKLGAGTRLAEIVAVLDRALAEKPRLAAVADRVAGRFVGALLVLAAATGMAWWFIDPSRALPVTVAVLVVSCPCALSLATPAALAAAGAALSRRGVLLTRGHTLETLARVTDVVLDKTGTLTEGRFAVAGIFAVGQVGERQCLALASALERSGEHPIARGIVQAAQRQGMDAACAAPDVLRNLPGQGIEAVVDGRVVRLGSKEFVSGLCPGAAPPNDGQFAASLHHGATPVWLGDDHGWLALFVLADVERRATGRLLARLRRQGVTCHLVSGDSAPTVRWWASHFGIERQHGQVGPEGKRDYVAALQRQGAIVLAVGDGINDAPVLAQAQVGIAIGSGAPLAQAGADAVLTHDGIDEIAHALTLARATRRVVRQNLAWAFAYNLTAIPLAASGHVSAWMAGVGMSLSSLLVVANAWRLLRAPAARSRRHVDSGEGTIPGTATGT
jgi:Cu2+-exporting ATPase